MSSHNRQAEQNVAVEAVVEILDTIEDERRDPDLWERAHIVRSINCIFRGLYALAVTEARLALTPLEQRGVGDRAFADDPLLADISLRTARLALAEAALVVVEHPSFGPIKLA